MATIYPGSEGTPKGQIRTFDEKVEKDISNMMGVNGGWFTSYTTDTGIVINHLMDKEGFIFALLEYIEKRDEHISKTDQASS